MIKIVIVKMIKTKQIYAILSFLIEKVHNLKGSYFKCNALFMMTQI